MTQWGLDTLFNPAKRHMDEEKRRLQSTREEVGDNSGGKRIDLESGKVSIKRADPEDETSPAEDPEGTDAPAAKDTRSRARGRARAASSTSSTSKGGTTSKGGPASKGARGTQSSDDGPSPAAIRAAQRRGRTAR